MHKGIWRRRTFRQLGQDYYTSKVVCLSNATAIQRREWQWARPLILTRRKITLWKWCDWMGNRRKWRALNPESLPLPTARLRNPACKSKSCAWRATSNCRKPFLRIRKLLCHLCSRISSSGAQPSATVINAKGLLLRKTRFLITLSEEKNLCTPCPRVRAVLANPQVSEFMMWRFLTRFPFLRLHVQLDHKWWN